MIRHPNSNRRIASDDIPAAFTLEHHIRDFALQYGIEETIRCFGQATIDFHMDDFINRRKLSKTCKYPPDFGFIGDHPSSYCGPNGPIVRSEEYPMTLDNLHKRIHDLNDHGLDGFITPRSTHFPLATFGIVAFKKGSYHNFPGFLE